MGRAIIQYCPRCGEFTFEIFNSHSYCSCCNYHPDDGCLFRPNKSKKKTSSFQTTPKKIDKKAEQEKVLVQKEDSYASLKRSDQQLKN